MLIATKRKMALFFCRSMWLLRPMWIKVCSAMISASRVISLNCTLLLIFPKTNWAHGESQCKSRAMQMLVISKISLSATKKPQKSSLIRIKLILGSDFLVWKKNLLRQWYCEYCINNNNNKHTTTHTLFRSSGYSYQKLLGDKNPVKMQQKCDKNLT